MEGFCFSLSAGCLASLQCGEAFDLLLAFFIRAAQGDFGSRYRSSRQAGHGSCGHLPTGSRLSRSISRAGSPPDSIAMVLQGSSRLSLSLPPVYPAAQCRSAQHGISCGFVFPELIWYSASYKVMPKERSSVFLLPG
jgi:hypothetical protein